MKKFKRSRPMNSTIRNRLGYFSAFQWSQFSLFSPTMEYFVYLAFRSNLKRDGYEYLFVGTVLTVMILQTDPIEYVEDICENMQLFPKEDFLTGDQLMFEFKPEVVAHHMQH